MLTLLLSLDHFTFSIVTIGLWMLFGFFSYVIFGLTLQTFNNYEKFTKKIEFVLYWTGLVHAFIATYASYYSLYYACEGWQQGKTPLNTNECFTEPVDIFYKFILNSASYLVYDFLAFYFIVQAKGTLANQTYIHHILSALSLYLTLYTDGPCVTFGALSLLMEASSIFLNFRWFTFEFKVTNTLVPLVNSIFLFVVYLIVRIFYQTYISFGFGYYHFYHDMVHYDAEALIKSGKNPMIYMACGSFMCVTNALSQVINWYWFSLICKQVYRNYQKSMG